MIKKRLFAIVLFALLILGLSSLSWRMRASTREQYARTTPTLAPSRTPSGFGVTDPRETARDWRVYTNTLYGYSFRYPPEAEIGELSDKSGRQEAVWQAVYLRLPSFYVEVIANQNRERLRPLEYALGIPLYSRAAVKQEVIVGGRHGVVFEYTEELYDGTNAVVPTRALFVDWGDSMLQIIIKSSPMDPLIVGSRTFMDIVDSSESTQSDYDKINTLISTLMPITP